MKTSSKKLLALSALLLPSIACGGIQDLIDLPNTPTPPPPIVLKSEVVHGRMAAWFNNRGEYLVSLASDRKITYCTTDSSIGEAIVKVAERSDGMITLQYSKVTILSLSPSADCSDAAAYKMSTCVAYDSTGTCRQTNYIYSYLKVVGVDQ